MSPPVRRAPLLLLALLLPIGPLAAAPDRAAEASVIVKLRAEGPHAVTACAERLTREGRAFAPFTEDRSDSLDRLGEALGVRGMHAVFRRADGSDFARQRRALRRRLERVASGRAPRAAAAEAPPDLAHVYRVALAPGADPRAAAARFRADPHVVWAQPNRKNHLDRLLDDPFLHSSGSWGQAYPDQWGTHVVAAPDAWDATLGAGVVVAVVDTGVDAGHPDLAGNLWVNPGEDLDGDGVASPADANGVDDDGNGFVDDLRGWDFQGDGAPGPDGFPVGDADPDDGNGHGTHVAGIVAARGDNGLAVAGIAPRATLLPVRVFPPIGGAEDALVWQGVLYAALAGADVVNGSFSCGAVCRSNPIAEEVLGFAAQLGVAFVTSAGNTGLDVMLKSPERLRESIVVGSLDPPSGESLSGFSSVGYLVDVAAPGRDVLSLAAAVAPEFWSVRRFVGPLAMRLDGTSMAAPHVSGVLALLLADDPSRTPEDLRAALRVAAHDLGAPGHDPVFGAGRLAAAASLAARPPDLRGRIDAPLPGDTLDEAVEAFAVRASIAGRDLVGAELELGAGGAPTDWTPLALERGAGTDALARLPVASLPDGAYVLRLTLRAADGRALREFAPFSLDRNVPVFVSSEAHVAAAPDVAGSRVVWQSARPTGDAEESALDLFGGVFGRPGEFLLVGDPGDQHDAVVSSDALAWRESGTPGTPERVVRACRFSGRRGACRPYEVSEGPGLRTHLGLSGRRLVYREVLGRAISLRVCRIGSRACPGSTLSVDTPFPRAPLLDGRRVLWASFAGADPFHTCVLDRDDACEAISFGASASDLEPVALAGSWLVLSGFSRDGRSAALYVCEIDFANPFCAAREVARLPDTAVPAADLSGHRLVWHAPGAHGQPDVFLCELGAGATCEPQALTRDAATQSHPRIDGTRVVWLDDRSGVPRVASFELPALRVPGRRTLREGEPLSLPVRVGGPPVPVVFSLRDAPAAGGAEGARLVAHGDGSARLLWTPPPGSAGLHRFTLRATRPGGLHTEASVAVEVLPARSASRP